MAANITKATFLIVSVGEGADDAQNFVAPLQQKKQLPLTIDTKILVDTYELKVDDVDVTLYHIKPFSITVKNLLTAVKTFVAAHKPDFFIPMGQGEYQAFERSFIEEEPPVVGGLMYHLVESGHPEDCAFVNCAYVCFANKKENHFTKLTLKLTRVAFFKRAVVVVSPDVTTVEDCNAVFGLLIQSLNEAPKSEFVSLFPDEEEDDDDERSD